MFYFPAIPCRECGLPMGNQFGVGNDDHTYTHFTCYQRLRREAAQQCGVPERRRPQAPDLLTDS